MTLEDLVEQLLKDSNLESCQQFQLRMKEVGEYGSSVELSVSRVEIDHENKQIVFVD